MLSRCTDSADDDSVVARSGYNFSERRGIDGRRRHAALEKVLADVLMKTAKDFILATVRLDGGAKENIKGHVNQKILRHGVNSDGTQSFSGCGVPGARKQY